MIGRLLTIVAISGSLISAAGQSGATTQAFPAQGLADFPAPADQASAFVGTTTTLCGAVARVERDGPDAESATLLRLDVDSKNQPVTIVVPTAARNAYGAGFDERARDLMVCAKGEVTRVDAGLQIALADAMQMRAYSRLRLVVVSTAVPSSTTEPSQSAPRPLVPGPGIVTPKLLIKVPTKYTRPAMAARIQGTVKLSAIVLPDGTVGTMRVTQSLDALFGLDEQATLALSQWRFVPGTKDGVPIRVQVGIELEFRLH